MNKYKTAKKVGEDNYGHPTAIVGGKKVLRSLKRVGVLRSCDVLRLGIMIFAMAAVWVMMPANGATD